MNILLNNPIASIFLLLFAVATITLVVIRFNVLKKFLKQFILVDDLNNIPEGILDYEFALELLQREIKKSERYNYPVSIAFLEITKNDSVRVDYLEALEDTVKRSIRETDVFGYWGRGANNNQNQFICVLPHTKFDETYELAERVRLKLLRRLSFSDDELKVSALENIDLETTDLNVQEFSAIPNPSKHAVNISCGVSSLDYNEGIDSFIDRATEALEAAKMESGNRTMPQPARKEVTITRIAKHLN